MRTETRTIYRINELSPAAKEKALDDYRDNLQEFFYTEDWIASIKKGLEAFNCDLKNYSIDSLCAARSSYSIGYADQDNEELTGQRLRTWILNNFYSVLYERKPQGEYKKRGDNWGYKRRSRIQYVETSCPFTGYCGDDYFLDPIRKFIADPDNSTFNELIDAAVENCLKGLQEDCEYQLTDEYISEHMESNDYEFTEEGNEI